MITKKVASILLFGSLLTSYSCMVYSSPLTSSCKISLKKIIDKEVNKFHRTKLSKDTDFINLYKLSDYNKMVHSLDNLIANHSNTQKFKDLKRIILMMKNNAPELAPVGNHNIKIFSSPNLKDISKFKNYIGYEINVKKANDSLHTIELFISNDLKEVSRKRLTEKLKATLAFLPQSKIDTFDIIRLHSKADGFEGEVIIDPLTGKSRIKTLEELIAEGNFVEGLADAHVKRSFSSPFKRKGTMQIYADENGNNYLNMPETKTAIAHEMGHLLINKMTGLFSIESYNRAILKDGVSVSLYGDSEVAEDLAETFMLYIQTAGGTNNWSAASKNLDLIFTTDVQIRGLSSIEIRLKYHERFKFFDDMFDDNKKLKKEFIDYIHSLSAIHMTMIAGSVVGGYYLVESNKP